MALARHPNFNISEVVLVGVDSGVLRAAYVQTDISATLKVANRAAGSFGLLAESLGPFQAIAPIARS